MRSYSSLLSYVTLCALAVLAVPFIIAVVAAAYFVAGGRTQLAERV